MGARRSRQEWQGLIERFEGSGQSAAQFCAERGIRCKTFSWWRWHLGEQLRARKSKGEVRLLPVKVAPVVAVPVCPPAPTALTVRVDNIEVRVEVGTNTGYVADLVAELRSRC